MTSPGPFTSPVTPGSGWPDDPATPLTPVAATHEDVRRLATAAVDVAELDARVSVCRACPRLVAWREQVAREKRRSYADQPYWGRPIAGWGDPAPRVLVVGLAPAAHGGNRTGRIFTGDRSGDWLFAALHRAGLAAAPTSTHAGDGQRLLGTRLVAAVRCAPPANAPTTGERDTCAAWLDAELGLVRSHLRVVVALGAFAWRSVLTSMGRQGVTVPRPRPEFGHGVELRVGSTPVIGSFHPSQQNTFTGRLTEAMLDDVFRRAAALATDDAPTLGS
ncbi:MAG: uracil-DNA glycosylase [Actinomycetes bacterium]